MDSMVLPEPPPVDRVFGSRVMVPGDDGVALLFPRFRFFRLLFRVMSDFRPTAIKIPGSKNLGRPADA